MGNRVNIAVKHQNQPAQCTLYLHWEGSRESTDAFFNATYDFMKSQNRAGDLTYFTARLIQGIGDFMGGSLSFGVHSDPLSGGEIYQDNSSKLYDISERAEEHDTEKYRYRYNWLIAYFNSTLSGYEYKSLPPKTKALVKQHLVDKLKSFNRVDRELKEATK